MPKKHTFNPTRMNRKGDNPKSTYRGSIREAQEIRAVTTNFMKDGELINKQ